MARVRAQIEHVVSQAGAIDVTAYQGRVTLSSSMAVHEVEKLLSAVAAVVGVTAVDNRLEINHAPAPAAGGRKTPRVQEMAGVSAFRCSSPAVAGPPSVALPGLQCHPASVSSPRAFHSFNMR